MNLFKYHKVNNSKANPVADYTKQSMHWLEGLDWPIVSCPLCSGRFPSIININCY